MEDANGTGGVSATEAGAVRDATPSDAESDARRDAGEAPRDASWDDCPAWNQDFPCGFDDYPTITTIEYQADLHQLAGAKHFISLTIANFGGASLAGLESVLCLDRLTIQDAENLESLDALRCLRRVGDLRLLRVPKLESLERLRRTHGDVYALNVIDAPSLHSLNGLEGLNRVHYLYLENVPVTSLVPFPNLAPDTVLVIQNTQLRDLHGLEGVTDVPYLFQIENNSELTSLAGLGAFRSTSNFFVDRNPKLPQCEVDRFRSRVQVVGQPGTNYDVVGPNGDPAPCPDAGAATP